LHCKHPAFASGERGMSVCLIHNMGEKLRRLCTGDRVSPHNDASIRLLWTRGCVMLRLSRRFIASIGAGVVAGLLSLSMANAQSTSDDASRSDWARDIFAKTLRDQTAISDQPGWSNISALSYVKSKRSGPPPATWLPQPMPAVDGINAKIDGYGGGASHSDGFYGTTGSLSFPLAQQWGAQIDGRVKMPTASVHTASQDTCSGATPPSASSAPMGPIGTGTGGTFGTSATSAPIRARSQRRASITRADGP
jgi:hypothetical protein